MQVCKFTTKIALRQNSMDYHNQVQIDIKLHTVCKITQMCEITDGVQNYTGVPFAPYVDKFLSLEKFNTHTMTTSN